MSLELKRTPRGFLLAEFSDRYGHRCSIQESSIAEEHCIWLGIDDSEPDGVPRMHLNQDMVDELLPLLRCFSEWGTLEPPDLPSGSGRITEEKGT